MLKLYSFLVSLFDIAETPIKTTQKWVGLVVINFTRIKPQRSFQSPTDWNPHYFVKYT